LLVIRRVRLVRLACCACFSNVPDQPTFAYCRTTAISRPVTTQVDVRTVIHSITDLSDDKRAVHALFASPPDEGRLLVAQHLELSREHEHGRIAAQVEVERRNLIDCRRRRRRRGRRCRRRCRGGGRRRRRRCRRDKQQEAAVEGQMTRRTDQQKATAVQPSISACTPWNNPDLSRLSKSLLSVGRNTGGGATSTWLSLRVLACSCGGEQAPAGLTAVLHHTHLVQRLVAGVSFGVQGHGGVWQEVNLRVAEGPTRTHTQTDRHAHTHTNTGTQAHTHAHTHTHARTHTHTSDSARETALS
jgi:hypothetical protein